MRAHTTSTLSQTVDVPVDWTLIWQNVASFVGFFEIPLTIAGVLVGAVVVRFILVRIIKRVVNQVVTGVKKKHRVDDTRELAASPLAAVRVVQRTRIVDVLVPDGHVSHNSVRQFV